MFFGVTLQSTSFPCTPWLPVSFSSLSSKVNGNFLYIANCDDRESNTDVIVLTAQEVRVGEDTILLIRDRLPVESVHSIAHCCEFHSSTFVCWIWDHDSSMIWTMLKSGMRDGRSRPDSSLCLVVFYGSLRFTLSLESRVRYSCVPLARA